MKVLLLGVGMQGKAALHDLAHSAEETRIVAADRDLSSLRHYVAGLDYRHRVRCEAVDALDPASLNRLAGQGFDVIVDLLPSRLSPRVAAAAVENRVHLVNTVYPLPEMKALAEAALPAGVTILPEFGMDPGIDLVLLGEAARGFDTVEEIWSYGAGIPEPAAADNPIRYKVTWTFEGVLRAYLRPGTIIREGRVVSIPADRQFFPENIHELDIEGLGRLEAYPNGDSVRYVELLGLAPADLRHMGRYALRWPGHCAFWRVMAGLHLLDDADIDYDGRPVNKRRFLARAIEPYIRMGDADRDVAIIRLEIKGMKDGEAMRAVYQVIDRRDTDTGLMAMNRCVGYTASIGAQMIVRGQINRRGLLSPVTDVPYEPFVAELKKRNIQVTRN